MPPFVFISAFGVVGGTITGATTTTISGPEPGYLYTVYADLGASGGAVPYAVDFSIDSGTTRVLVDASNRATWQPPRVYQSGNLAVSARPIAKSNVVGAVGATSRITVTQNLETSVPTLSVDAPRAGLTVRSAGAGAETVVTARTADTNQFGPRVVTVRADSRQSVQLAAVSGSTTQWAGTISLSEMPLGDRTITITCACGPSLNIINTVVVHITNVDGLPPVIQMVLPASPGGAVIVDPATLTAVVRGTLTDSQTGVRGGATSVGVALSASGPQAIATPGAVGDWSTWSVAGQLPSLGSFTLYVWATDAAGNTTPTPLVWPIVAISSYVPSTLGDRLSEVQYLSALMQFARDQVTAGTSGPVSSALLNQALGQPLDEISLPLNAAAKVDINELRVPLEILRSHIASSGISTQPDAAGEANYLWTAYQALLAGLGTSFTELRMARGADDATRQAIAERLGMVLSGPAAGQPRPDQLDALTLDASAVTEAVLESLFGLLATTLNLDPFRTVQPQILSWQLAAQRSRWLAHDAAPTTKVAYTVTADPDVITASDVLQSSPQATQLNKLLTSRTQQLTTQATALDQTLQSTTGTDAARLTALLTQSLPGVDLSTLQDLEAQGVDISSQLAAEGLDRGGFSYLLQLKAVAALGTVSPGEWNSVIDVLVGAFRRKQYPVWVTQETGITLSPELFVLSTTAPVLSTYRIDPRARIDWRSTLRTRIQQRQALLDGSTQRVATAEQASLGKLRDALVLDVAGPTGDTVAASTSLARQYQIDVGVAGSISTTRLRQAISSLQSLLVSIRSGDNLTVTTIRDWRLTNGFLVFDAGWSWLGTVPRWRSATTTFLFAEATLDPMMLAQPATPPTGTAPSAEFLALRTALAISGPIDATSPDSAVTGYQSAMTRVLRSKGVLQATDSLVYLGDRSVTRQTQLATWSAAMTTDQTLAREVFWAVPLMVAQRLHASGQFQAALDWYWVVYPYNTSGVSSSFSWINTEIATPVSAAVPADLTFPPGWTSRLNPFGLVWTGRASYPYRPYTWLRATLLSIISCLIDYADSEFGVDTHESLAHARDLYMTAASLLGNPTLAPITPSSAGEATLAIPQLTTLTARVTVQLAKLRQGRNIAGLSRTQAITTGTAISQPTPYHYKVLAGRAAQLVQQATAIEAAYLAALEKYDNKTLQVAEARNAGEVAAQQLNVYAARVQEAQDGIAAATAQQTRAATMSKVYDDSINAPPNQYEQALLDAYPDMRTAQNLIAGADAAIGIAQAAAGGMDVWKNLFSFGAAAVSAAAQIGAYSAKAGLQMWLNNLQSQAQANQLKAGLEDRRQQWRIARASADQDILVAEAQVTTANDQLAIMQAEQIVAVTQSHHALDTLNLLLGQFTSPDLYKWISDTLGGVYRYFLQQATATARLAQAQLAFERAEPEKTYIRTDYWQQRSTARTDGATTPDRRGLTGAERIAQDLSLLDQYAFSTDTRRLNLSQTFSLSQLLPVELVRFRLTGQIGFTTPMEWFDQDFPGHYQRLIRQVHVSVVALVPPSRGIRASLSSSGISRVTTASDGLFSEVLLRRNADIIALTSPLNATGVFQLDLQPEMLLPFEGGGVSTSWELVLPRASNPFDFSTISDVLLTIDYTALSDPVYQAQVVRRLNGDLGRSSDRVFSLVMDFPDLWYELLNDNTTAPPAVAFNLRPEDFPPNVITNSLRTTHVVVQISANTTAPNLPITLTRGGDTGVAQTDATGIASTRRSATAWNALTGTTPIGQWSISFDAAIHPLLQSGAIDDVRLVISWSGQTPPWPT